MTLATWLHISGNTVVRNQHGTCVTIDPKSPHHSDLFHLIDFKVSTVSGPVAWLVPVRQAA